MRIKSPTRLITVLVTLAVIIWMTCNFIIALKNGEQYSFFGNGGSGKGSQTFVVAGVDKDGYRTDLLLLCQINKRDHKIQVLQIPRDTKITNKRADKKINSAYYSGFDVLKREIEQVTGIAPEKYIMVDFSGFRDIVDAAGGVTMEVPMDMKYSDPYQNLTIDLKKGKQHLNGAEAEMFMRFRSGYPEGDTGRLEAQKGLYSAVAKKMFSPVGILRLPVVYGAVKKHTDTNMTGGEIIDAMWDAIWMGKKNLEINTLPGGGRYIGGGSYFVHDKEETRKLIEEKFVIGK